MYVARSLTFLSILLSACASLLGQDLQTMQRMLDGNLRPDAEVSVFEHSERLYPSAIVKGSHVTVPLAAGHPLPLDIKFRSGAREYDLVDYLAQNRVAGILVLKNNKVAFEDYELGAQPSSRWPSFSIAKSVTSTLVGIAIQQGFIHSLDDLATRYLPSLAGTAYADVTIRNLLQMASGVRWDETYTDPNSDCRRLLNSQMTGRPGASIEFMRSLKKAGAPGSIWNYNSGEINLVGAIVEKATGKPLAAYLSETLWTQLGMEQDATWWQETANGMGLGGVGIGATLRDYGRFGDFVANDGVLNGKRFVPAGWFAEAGSAHRIGNKTVEYGYLWWPVVSVDPIHAGAFQALGIFGQHIYINPVEHLVIVVLSARPKPTGSPVLDDLSFFASVARALRG